MAQAYSAGLTVSDNYVLKKERILPLKGEVKVKKGDWVKAEDLVAQTLLPGSPFPFKIANKLGCTASMLKKFLKVENGTKIEEGSILAETNGLFGTGIFKTVVKAPFEGEVESISHSTGNMILRKPKVPVEVKAFLEGRVTEVIQEEGVIVENKVTYIQGIFGIGGETFGQIKMLAKDPNDVITPEQIDESCKDKIVVSGAMIPIESIRKAIKVGAVAIITGGINDHDLKELLGYNIGVAITGHEEIGLSIVCTEGFGNIKMAQVTFDLLKKYDGHHASCHGKTQIRAGVMRPEIIIPQESKNEDFVVPEAEEASLEIGTDIRVIREPGFGKIGVITELPEALHKVQSETKVRILKAKLEDGKEVLLPRANVEVISE
ncbi:MAG: hypothetical protein U9N34_00820 [Candidatus Cloacimonadota bacterium]|nr:hypothetical protein [Candidatus Cloacimonadota bacterium]